MKWEKLYSNIQFFAGNRKCDWYKLYSFPDKEKDIEHLYSSMQGNKLDDLFPYYYAKKNNRNNLDKEWGKSILMIDFVHIK